VLTSEAVLIYSIEPRPTTVEVIVAVTYEVEIYPEDPSPATVDCVRRELRYPEEPRPTTVDTKTDAAIELINPEDPKPTTVD